MSAALSLNRTCEGTVSARPVLDVLSYSATLTSPARPPRDLTGRQRQVLAYVIATVLRSGSPPTLREIGVHLGISSTNGPREHVAALVRKGALTHDARIARGIRVVGMPSPKAPPLSAVSTIQIHDRDGRPVAQFFPLPALSRGANR